MRSCISFDEIVARRNAQVARQSRDVALRDISLCDLAAIRARPAIDRRLDFLGDAPEAQLREIMPLQITAELLVLRLLLFSPELPDLHQIR